jgi:NAD(P)-dependent dehydrogenase (short-subunit alcohol dehydrogenase family)
MTRALITGANRGIGLALARALVEHDVFVFAGARKVAAATEREGWNQGCGDRLQVVPLDVTSVESIRHCVQAVRAVTDHLDILVNNAAVFPEEGDETLADLNVDGFDQAFAVNVTGVARVTQALLPLLLHSPTPRIVNVSSGAGSIGEKTDHRYYCYGASKAALNCFTVGLANELRPRNVPVVAISPGWVRTDMGGPEAELSPEESAAALAGTILKLSMDHSGTFLDRFGRRGEYKW